MPYGVHVVRWDELPGLVDAVHDRFGRLDALINNAGLSPVFDALGSVTEKLFDAVVNLNLKGPRCDAPGRRRNALTLSWC